MRLIQRTGAYEPMFLEICQNAIDRREFIDVVTDSADTEYEIPHGLGFIPLGFLVINQDKAGVTYASGTAWTTEKIFLKCSVATVAQRVLIF